jgi:hypothetical protein
MSRMKPKVRARLTSFRKLVVEKSIVARLRVAMEHRVVELDLEVDAEALEGSKRAHFSPSFTSTGRRHAHEPLRGVLQLDPADWMRNTNGPALPSMIGTSPAV